MTSSMITGEQRWASKRRGGMTVLGKVAKVAVPKPLNLPSQRLENHGLDPNVEIVPKGTLSWGSRPSSGSSNAWGTSAVSPSTDGGSSSPSHLAGRPLSGGGTRPSTAGSEKAHDSNDNSWGPNSRPSSASGVLGSNHASLTSLRPHSAETRPLSSHLSRFAKPSPEGSRTWAADVSYEQTGVSEGFSLSSGDFPTLGSEKDESRRNLEPQDASHGRPGSSSEVKSVSDRMEIAHDDARDTDINGHSWRKDGLIVEDGPRPSMDRLHGDPHMRQNPNIGPPHYDAWRGPPSVPPSGGVWYRGPPGPPPYGGPVPPGGFHMEPFPYYRPQVPAPVLTNSPSIPPPVAGLHGHHPKNGDMYRPHMADSFMHQGMPMRPGFYPPPVPYEGYYRPPMGFGNPNERDFHFMGMAGGPPMYGRPANQNAPDINGSHTRSHEGRGPTKIDPGLLYDRGNYRILGKSDDGRNQNDEEKWGHRVSTDGSNREKGILSNSALQEAAWGDDYKARKSPDYDRSAAKDEVPSASRKIKSHTSDHANVNLSGRVSNLEEPDTAPVKDNLASSREHSLIQKIEGLNAKVRASGGSMDAFHREERTERVQLVNDCAHQSVAGTEVVLERHHPTGVLVPIFRDTHVASEKRGDSVMTAGPRRTVHGAQNRGNRHGKGNFDGQEASGWGRRSQSSAVEDHNSAVQSSEVHNANVEMKVDRDPAMSDVDRSDTQRAKMREIAKQRAIQLQKEEEERIREQKAKALAKLEELNRRSTTQSVDFPSKKDTVPSHSTGPSEPVVSRDQSDLEANSMSGLSTVFPNKVAEINENGASKVVDATSTISHTGADRNRSEQQDSSSSQIRSPADGSHFEDAAIDQNASQVRDVSKHKQAGYKPRQNVPIEKNLSQFFISVGQIDVLIDPKGENINQEVTLGSKVDGGAGKEIPETSHKRRNNKSGKNKHKAEDISNAISSTVSPNNFDHGHQTVSASTVDNSSNLHSNSTSVQLSADVKEPSQGSGNHSLLPHEDVHGRINNSRNAQYSRKPRSSQGNRLSEKAQSNDGVVWTPVRMHNKIEITDETHQKAAEPSVVSEVGENVPQISSKTKRAEMERYVPKPVAKELAQGSSQQPYSLLGQQHSSSGTGGREKASQGVPIVEGKSGHTRGQGSWRQRVSTESNASKNIHLSSGLTVTPNDPGMMEPLHKTTEQSLKGPEDSVSDGLNFVNDSSSKPSDDAFTGSKDQLPSGRGKRHPFKGQKGSGTSRRGFDHRESKAGLTDSHCSMEMNHTEKTVSSKDNRAVVDRSAPHWQPKSQVYGAHNQQQSKSQFGQSHMAADNRGLKPDSGLGSDAHSQSQYIQGTAKNPKLDSEDKAMQDIGQQESRREKRGYHVKGRPYPPSLGLEGEVEDGRNEQRPSSGYRHNSNYGGRVNRVHESRGDWSTTAPEIKQHYSSTNPERQRQNSHYEYQPVGTYSSSNYSGSQTEKQQGGLKYQDRGQTRRGRGNFHGRQSSNE